MTKSIFTKLIVIIEAEDDNVNNRFEDVEDEYVRFFDRLDEIAGSDEYALLTFSITEE